MNFLVSLTTFQVQTTSELVSRVANPEISDIWVGVSRPAVLTAVIVSWRSVSRERTRDGASMQNRSCIDSMTNEPAQESPASILLSTARIKIHVKVRSSYFAVYRVLRDWLSSVSV